MALTSNTFNSFFEENFQEKRKIYARTSFDSSCEHINL